MAILNKEICTRLILVVIGILIVGGFVFFGVRSYWQWQETHYFGEVIRIANGGIVISDAKVGERVIDISERTAIKRGRQAQQNGLQAGDKIIVVGEKSADGHIKALLIRIVEDKKSELPRRNLGE